MTDLISRADAIEAVHDWLEEQEYGHNDATEYLATEYLFKTLSELPSAELPNGDLISRTDAIKAVLSLPMPLRLADEIDETLRSLPSADAVHGEWVDMEIPCNPYPPVFCVECSRCGYRVGRETFLENTFNYCPSCGARMKGGAE